MARLYGTVMAIGRCLAWELLRSPATRAPARSPMPELRASQPAKPSRRTQSSRSALNFRKAVLLPVLPTSVPGDEGGETRGLDDRDHRMFTGEGDDVTSGPSRAGDRHQRFEVAAAGRKGEEDAHRELRLRRP